MTIRTALSRLAVCVGVFFLLAAPPSSAKAQGATGGARSFKVVKPPKRGARTRINIGSVKTARPPSRSGRQAHAWFWREAAAAIREADPDRASPLARRAAQRIAGEAEKERIERVAGTWRAQIAAAGAGAGVSAALIAAVIAAESAGDARAVSRAGAQGLAQLMPGTAARFDVEDPFDPAENLRGSAEYLSILLEMFDEDLLLALAGYNAGENAVLRHEGVPPFSETRDYVPIVLGYFDLARRLCAAPADGPRDACDLKTE